MDRSWYLNRLRAMGPGEIAHRCIEKFQEHLWRRHYYDARPYPKMISNERRVQGGLSRAPAAGAPSRARERLIERADELLAGRWATFEVSRSDVTADVNWHLDPKTGICASAEAYAFDIPFVGGAAEFDIKYVWELSRHHQTTLLAMAFWLTGEDRYARAAVAQIESWISANPFLHGLHWASGIELGMRLIAFSWTRRLLDDWPDVRREFEGNEQFGQCVFLHQWVLAHRSSHGSSANNHLLYEMAGLFISCCAMPWHENARAWQDRAAAVLGREFPRQVFREGYDRELASDYNGFVLEALLLCLVETQLGPAEIDPRLWDCARRMFRWLQENSDCRGHPPRQGDSDDASGLLLDAPDYDRWLDLVQWGTNWFESASRGTDSLRAFLFAPLRPEKVQFAPAADSDSRSAGSGLAILRAGRGTAQEIYCAFDAGPLGYLSIAAHGHADALAVELRYGGIPILVDSGTYTYHGPWRDYFRSTAAHNTIEMEGLNQSESGGPFLWTRHARARLLHCEGLAEDAPLARAAGEHEGYLKRSFRGRHRRTVELNRRESTLTIRDEIGIARPCRCRVLFHLHPDLACTLRGASAELHCGENVIRMELPPGLGWRAVRGGEEPGAGWYSPSYGVRVPSTTLTGESVLDAAVSLVTVVSFPPRE